MAEKRTYRLKRVLFGILLLGISVPLIQHITHFSNESGLWGAIEPKESAEFTSESWFDGSYQEKTDAYLNESFGFRNSFVRLRNQLQFSLFSIPHANSVVIGKDWYLYEENYIHSYYGRDFIGDSIIQERTRKLRFLQDTLQQQGKCLLVVLAPGKGSFFPEYFPDSLKGEKSRTNYESYLEAFNAQNIECLDFKKWFLENKATSKYPLYPKGGIHWSKYGEILAADSLIKHIEKVSQFDLPDLVIDRYDVKAKNEQGDYDIGKGMNLLFQIPVYPMAYPVFHFEQPEKNTVKTLFVADSYYWGMYNNKFSELMFGHGQFWFYNEEMYELGQIAEGKVSEIDIQTEVEKNNVIVLMSTDANLNQFAFGFIERLYEAYQK